MSYGRAIKFGRNRRSWPINMASGVCLSSRKKECVERRIPKWVLSVSTYRKVAKKADDLLNTIRNFHDHGTNAFSNILYW